MRRIFLVAFRRQLGELDVITERLKSRYYTGSEVTSVASTARCSSVPPPSTVLPLNLTSQMNTQRPELDTARSTSTTIQTDFLEQFPESLSGRPLMSNGVNVTDVLSMHNDQVRLAQELMSKANHLLESSKDFFTKPATPPPPPTLLSTIVERSSPPSPPALPNFDTTREFRAGEKSPAHVK